jgi:hypothetical protein
MEMHFKKQTYQHWDLWTLSHYKSRPSSLISRSIFTGRLLTECWDADATQQRLAKDVHFRSPNHPRISTHSARQMLVSPTNLHIPESGVVRGARPNSLVGLDPAVNVVGSSGFDSPCWNGRCRIAFPFFFLLLQIVLLRPSFRCSFH